MTLREAIPLEMARVRDELLPLYDAIPAGIFAATLMRLTLDRATRALADGDAVEMVRCFQELKEFE